MNTTCKVAIVILEDANGRIAMQLRDDRPDIRYPNHWGIFGGAIEGSELPIEAAMREIQEELSFSLNAAKLAFLRPVYTDDGVRIIYVFRYLLADELERAILTEGQTYQLLTREEITQGTIQGRRVVPHHLSILNWYWNQINFEK